VCWDVACSLQLIVEVGRYGVLVQCTSVCCTCVRAEELQHELEASCKKMQQNYEEVGVRDCVFYFAEFGEP
jgi:hypothetical protein